MTDQAKPRHASGLRLLLLLVAAVIAWQGVQAIAIGALGVPGLYLVRIFEPGPGSAVRKIAPKAPEVGEPWRKSADRPAPETPKVARVPEPAANLPSRDELAGWIRGQAREFVGGVDAAGNMLYRFDVWLDMPAAVKDKAVSVAYAFDAPSAQPPTENSKDAKTGFRVKFGGAVCAESVSVTVTFADGRTRETQVNGCQLLN